MGAKSTRLITVLLAMAALLVLACVVSHVKPIVRNLGPGATFTFENSVLQWEFERFFSGPDRSDVKDSADLTRPWNENTFLTPYFSIACLIAS